MVNPILVLFPLEVRNKLRHVAWQAEAWYLSDMSASLSSHIRC